MPRTAAMPLGAVTLLMAGCASNESQVRAEHAPDRARLRPSGNTDLRQAIGQ